MVGRYQIKVIAEPRCVDTTHFKGSMMRELCDSAARLWRRSWEPISERIGCPTAQLANADLPVLAVDLRELRFQGGHSNSTAVVTFWLYLLPGFIYYGIPQEHGITASADVEMRYRGDVLWRARVHEQGIVNLSGFSDEDFLRDTARGSEREPWLSYTITTTLARLTKKILATAKQQNELLRSGS